MSADVSFDCDVWQVGIALHYSSLSTLLWIGVSARVIYKEAVWRMPRQPEGESPAPPTQRPMLRSVGESTAHLHKLPIPWDCCLLSIRFMFWSNAGVLVHGHPDCAPSKWAIVPNNHSPSVCKESLEGHNRSSCEAQKNLLVCMNSEWGRGGMYETNIREAERVAINQSRGIRGYTVFPYIPFYSSSCPYDPEAAIILWPHCISHHPFVAHSATWDHVAINLRLQESELTPPTLCPLTGSEGSESYVQIIDNRIGYKERKCHRHAHYENTVAARGHTGSCGTNKNLFLFVKLQQGTLCLTCFPLLFKVLFDSWWSASHHLWDHCSCQCQ